LKKRAFSVYGHGTGGVGMSKGIVLMGLLLLHRDSRADAERRQ
jgi:hypothetical protein